MQGTAPEVGSAQCAASFQLYFRNSGNAELGQGSLLRTTCHPCEFDSFADMLRRHRQSRTEQTLFASYVRLRNDRLLEVPTGAEERCFDFFAGAPSPG